MINRGASLVASFSITTQTNAKIVGKERNKLDLPPLFIKSRAHVKISAFGVVL